MANKNIPCKNVVGVSLGTRPLTIDIVVNVNRDSGTYMYNDLLVYLIINFVIIQKGVTMVQLYHCN